MSNMRNIGFVLLFLMASLSGFSQEITVLDADTGNPVANIAIFNKDKSKTSVSNLNGKANLDIFD
ncbi:MAG: hypothetical protein AB3N10_18840, partial [Allomuricauda sp.]